MKTQNYTPVRPSTALTWDELSLREQEIQELEPRTTALPTHEGVYVDSAEEVSALYVTAMRAYASAKKLKDIWEDTEEQEGFWVFNPNTRNNNAS